MSQKFKQDFAEKANRQSLN